MKTLNLLLAVGMTGMLGAQAFRPEIPDDDQAMVDRQRDGIFQAIEEIAQPVGSLVFKMYSGREPLGYAVSLGEEKFIAKWSELERRAHPFIYTEDSGGMFIEVEGVYPEHDLAVLRVNGLKAPKAKWASGVDLPAGSFLAAVGEGGKVKGLGVVSVPARSLLVEEQGFLGVRLSNQRVKAGVLVEQAVRGLAAYRVGIRSGDVIMGIDGQEVTGFFELSSKLRRLKAGSQPKIDVLRGEERIQFEPTLGGREKEEDTPQIQSMNQMSGAMSRVRDSFPKVIQSDMDLEAFYNGLPVIDLKGRLVGISIAREGRISQLILPGEVIASVLKTEPRPVKLERLAGPERE